MNANSPTQGRLTGIFVATLGTFLIVAGLVWVMYHYTRPAPLNQARVEERKKALAEVSAEGTKALSEADVLDPIKGVIRLPISNAMDIILKEYANPAVAKSNLVARMEKATAKPPAAPPPPNPYE
jgi:hypothetical protein